MTVAEDQMAWVRGVEGDFAFTDLWAKYAEIVGLTITGVSIIDDGVTIDFADGYLLIQDDGQSCCESRYITCDDDVTGHAGGQLVSIDTDAPSTATGPEDDDESYDVHDVQFVKVQTTKGSFTLCTHNVHNGYYGGFSIKLKLVR